MADSRGSVVVSTIAGVAMAVVVCASGLSPETPRSLRHRTLAVIVNRHNPLDELSAADVRRIFLRKAMRWPHGRAITVVVRGECLSGLVPPPPPATAARTVGSTQNMLRFVFNAPGAIGYVRADELHPSVKVLRIDGRWPGEPGYPLVLPTTHAAQGESNREVAVPVSCGGRRRG